MCWLWDYKITSEDGWCAGVSPPHHQWSCLICWHWDYKIISEAGWCAGISPLYYQWSWLGPLVQYQYTARKSGYYIILQLIINAVVVPGKDMCWLYNYSSSPVIWTLKQFFNFFCSATAYYIEKNTWACSNPLYCSIHAKKIARLWDLRAVEHIRESGCRTRGYHSSGQRHISDVTLSPFGVSQPTLVSKSFNFCTADWGYPLGANPYHLRGQPGPVSSYETYELSGRDNVYVTRHSNAWITSRTINGWSGRRTDFFTAGRGAKWASWRLR